MSWRADCRTNSRRDGNLLSGFALQGTDRVGAESAQPEICFLSGSGRNWKRCCEALRPNEPAPSSVPDSDAESVLAAAGILIQQKTGPVSAIGSEERSGRASSAISREEATRRLGDLIHPFHIAALRRYYRYLIRTGAIRLGDGQSPRRYVAYNEPVARFFHHDITAKL